MSQDGQWPDRLREINFVSACRSTDYQHSATLRMLNGRVEDIKD
jgi:hypothetical protein